MNSLRCSSLVLKSLSVLVSPKPPILRPFSQTPYHPVQPFLSVQTNFQTIVPPCRQMASSFFNRRTVDELWKAVTTVSNQGRQRGRARGLIRIKNLYVGHKLGVGSARIAFPGLSRHAISEGRTATSIGTIDEAAYEKYQQDLLEARLKGKGKRGKIKQTPLERGWTSATPLGRKFGTPQSQSSELSFNGFESILIEYRTIVKMTGTFGRTRTIRLLMLTGNGNGTAGFSLTRSPTGRGSHTFQRAVNRAGLRLVTIDLYENRTVFHDFFTKFGQTTIFVQQRPAGAGFEGHRILKAICELIGIKDVKCTVEGNRNPLHMTKAFFLGLLRQRTHQMLANEKKLHLVELREENDNFPRLVASPESGRVRTKDEIDHNEILDFESIAFDGNMPYYKPPSPIFWERLPSYQIRLRKIAAQRHHKSQRLQMLLEEGLIASHLTPKFSECKPAEIIRKKKEAE